MYFLTQVHCTFHNKPSWMPEIPCCLNIKMSSYQYRDSHVKDKTVLRPSTLIWESPYLGKRVFILRRGLEWLTVRSLCMTPQVGSYDVDRGCTCEVLKYCSWFCRWFWCIVRLWLCQICAAVRLWNKVSCKGCSHCCGFHVVTLSRNMYLWKVQQMDM